MPAPDVIAEDPVVGWNSLTRMRNKAELYRTETYFREAVADVEAVLGAGTARVLHRSALVIIKADGLLAGKQRIIHDFLVRHDLRPVAARRIFFTRMLAREFWRYQLTLASLDRLAVNDWVLTAGPAVLLLLRSDGEHDLPATVRLSGLKGAANQDAQQPDSLRGLLGQPNRLVNFFHCAEEPADIVRELGMLFDRPTRYALLHALAGGQLTAADADVLADVLSDDTPACGLDAAAAVQRLAEAVAACDPDRLDPAVRADLDAGLKAMRANQIVDWRRFEDALLASRAEVDHWDVAMAGSSFTANDVAGGRKVLVNPDPDSWRTKPRVRPGIPWDISVIGEPLAEAEVAVRAVADALALARSGAGADEVSRKSGRDIVTATDVRIEDQVRTFLHDALGDTVVGEERGGEAVANGRHWLVDPICGTRNYASGIPLYCVNLALVRQGSVALAVIGDPTSGDLLLAQAGKGSWALRPDGAVNRLHAGADSQTLVIEDSHAKGSRREHAARFAAAAVRADRWELRSLSTTLSLAYVATGQVCGYALFWTSDVHAAAGSLLAAEAGAIVTDLRGQPWTLGADSLLAAADAGAHQELRTLLDAANQAGARS